MSDAVVRYRRSLIIILQAAFVLLSTYLAYWFRFDGEIPAYYVALIWWTAPFVVVIRGLFFVPFRLYEGYWRYASFGDVARIVGAVLSSSVALWVVLRWVLGLSDYSRSVMLLDPILLIVMITGSRISGRLWRELRRVPRERRVLIYGAGDAGEMIARDMRHNQYYDHEPVGFIDDDPAKKGISIQGVRVLGGLADLPGVVEREKPDEILVAIPSAEPSTIRRIVRALEPYKIPILTLPNVRDLLTGKVSLTEVRSLSYEDLLPRPAVDLDAGPIRSLVRGRRVMVTGAGGSIGSELCRQILRHAPGELFLVDFAETALFTIEREIVWAGQGIRHRAVLADVRQRERMNEIVRDLAPEIVFHAAAYKHVPLVEANPAEGVLNNVIGTRNVIDAAIEHGVQRFVLVSTDKAVNPAGVMGMTKRLAELYVQALSATRAVGSTTLCAVRFGNVLGSSGSVIPIFQSQIERGGPVTVTDPEITRYFMTLAEAAQLVIHAAALARPGDVFVLDMGEQLRILDLARNLIRLAGFVPEEEIPISIIGLRPGEKLAEELHGDGETLEPSEHEKISRLRTTLRIDAATLARELDEIESLANGAPGDVLRSRLEEVIRGWERREAAAAS